MLLPRLSQSRTSDNRLSEGACEKWPSSEALKGLVCKCEQEFPYLHKPLEKNLHLSSRAEVADLANVLSEVDRGIYDCPSKGVERKTPGNSSIRKSSLANSG